MKTTIVAVCRPGFSKDGDSAGKGNPVRSKDPKCGGLGYEQGKIGLVELRDHEVFRDDQVYFFGTGSDIDGHGIYGRALTAATPDEEEWFNNLPARTRKNRNVGEIMRYKDGRPLVAENGLSFKNGKWYKWVNRPTDPINQHTNPAGIAYVRYRAHPEPGYIEYDGRLNNDGKLLTYAKPLKCDDKDFVLATDDEIKTHVSGASVKISVDGSSTISPVTSEFGGLYPKAVQQLSADGRPLIAENDLKFVKGEWYLWTNHRDPKVSPDGLMYIKFEETVGSKYIHYSRRVSNSGKMSEREPFETCDHMEFVHATEEEVQAFVLNPKAKPGDFNTAVGFQSMYADLKPNKEFVDEFVPGRWYRWAKTDDRNEVGLRYVKHTRVRVDGDGDEEFCYNEKVSNDGNHETYHEEDFCDVDEFVDATEEEVMDYISSKGKLKQPSKHLHATEFEAGRWYKWDKVGNDKEPQNFEGDSMLYVKVTRHEAGDLYCSELVSEDGDHEPDGDGEGFTDDHMVLVSDYEVLHHIKSKGKEPNPECEPFKREVQQLIQPELISVVPLEYSPSFSPLYYMDVTTKSSTVSAKCTDKDGNAKVVTANDENEARKIAAEQNLDVDYIITE
jgi:hypothetical protein